MLVATSYALKQGLTFVTLHLYRSAADYLSGCTDANERQFANGKNEKVCEISFGSVQTVGTSMMLTICIPFRLKTKRNPLQSVPSNPAAFAEAYRNSETYKRVITDRENYLASIAQANPAEQEFRAAVAEDKRKGVGKKSPYTVSFFSQVVTLTKRQFLLCKQDTFSIWTGYSTSVAIAIIWYACLSSRCIASLPHDLRCQTWTNPCS